MYDLLWRNLFKIENLIIEKFSNKKNKKSTHTIKYNNQTEKM